MRLLAAGVTVSRTDDDLVRYHGKLMIVDRRVLFLLGFNFTYLDIERSRSFGIVTTNKKHVEQAAKLFDADTMRKPYSAGSKTFIVSPVNARRQLTAFIGAAKKELLIYDPEISDPAMIRTLEARVKAGVAVRIIGNLKSGSTLLPEAKTLHFRLHTRSIVRDNSWAFVGSQSLRTAELDSRREVGLVFRDAKAVSCISQTFAQDWDAEVRPAVQPLSADEEAQKEQISTSKVARKVARAVVDDLPPVTQVLKETLRELSASAPDAGLSPPDVETVVKEAVKNAVKEAVHNLVEEATETKGAGAE